MVTNGKIFTNKKYLTITLSLILIYLILLIYQEKITDDNAKEYANYVNLIENENNRDEIIINRIEKLSEVSESEMLTNSFFKEYQLLNRIKEYSAAISDYHTNLAARINNLQSINKFTDNVSIEKKNKKYIEAYSKCNQVKLKFGNYVAIERIITDKKAIIFIAILVIMTVYFSFVEERNSGVYELFFSMKNGTTKIYITKYFACVTICIIEVALLLTVQLLAYISIYGISDLNVSIQSVGILVNSPYPISVFMMIVLYFTFLFFITIMLVAIFSCIGSCPTGLMGYMMGIVIYLLINFRECKLFCVNPLDGC